MERAPIARSNGDWEAAQKLEWSSFKFVMPEPKPEGK